MSLPSLAAFLEAASADAALQAQLLQAPDAASLAAIAQAAGFAVAEADWLAASDAGRAELAPEPEPWQALAADPWADDPAPSAAEDGAPGPAAEPADPLVAFLHQAQGDPALQEALAQAPDTAAVAELAQQAGYPLTSAHLWAATEAIPEELQGAPRPQDLEPQEGASSAGDAVLQRFLRQLEGDAALQQALAEAADAAAVAAIAQAAGYAISPADLWAASGAEPEELVVPLLVIEA